MRRFIAPLLLLFLILTIFHSWFAPGLLSSYDLPYYSRLMMKEAGFRLYAWNWHPGFDGFAGFFSPYSWVFPFIYIPQAVFGKYLGMDWAFIERIVYLYPLLTLLIFSPIFLFKTIFAKNKFYVISVLVFSFNTYALLLSGGEIFVALAYSLIPLIFALFIKIINRRNLRLSILTGIVLAIQVMLDPRITYVTMFAVGFYLLFYIGLRIKTVMRNMQLINYKIIIYLLTPFIIAGLLNAFWIIPTVLYGKNPVETLGSSYSTTEAVKYLSFAKFEQTISLLQQNWPENIFGKVDFMKPEFLLLPILAYASLLFIYRKQKKDNMEQISLKSNQLDDNRTIILFALLGSIGSFLSKGANDPFGGIYLWMFGHIPGFIMFRDPAKWYPLVAISYAVLIPFTTVKIFELLSKVKEFSIFNLQFSIKSKIFNLQNIFLLTVIFYLLLTIRPALFGQLGGMFKTTSVPDDYVKLEKFLYNQPGFFRTLWVPSKQHFGYYSNTHPEISAQVLFNVYDDKELFKKFSDNTMEKLLEEASIKYVIVPYDSEKEIFITDRKYDNNRYLRAVSRLQEIKWLKEVEGFGKIAVFEIGNPRDHFWSLSGNIKISYNYINSTRYLVSINNGKKGDLLVFDEAFDSKWVAKVVGQEGRFISPITYPLSPTINLNSFVLPVAGNYSLEVYYLPQKWVNIGIIISLTSLIFIILLLLVLTAKHEKEN